VDIVPWEADSWTGRVTLVGKRAEALVAYPWPGNVRELRNAVERAMIVSCGSTLLAEAPAPEGAPPHEGAAWRDDGEPLHILAVLEETGRRVGGPHGAATRLGLRPTSLERRMAKLGIKRGPAPPLRRSSPALRRPDLPRSTATRPESSHNVRLAVTVHTQYFAERESC
jgi:hypothetical protein